MPPDRVASAVAAPPAATACGVASGTVMDFLAICQGLGLALAAGLLVGAVVPPVMPAWGVVAGAAPLGVVACGLALDGEGEAVWPALPIGVIAAGLAGIVARDVVAGASRRVTASDARGETGRPAAGGVPVIVVLAALILALLSLFVPPVSLAALAALGWLWLARRRRAEQKHEGLRVLR